MYFWNVEALVKDFRENNVSQRDQFRYVIALFVFGALFLQHFFSAIAPTSIFEYTTADWVGLLAGAAVNVWGVSHCFKVNSTGDDRDFMLRFFCLMWPVSIKFMVAFMVVSFVFHFVFSGLIENLPVADLESNGALYIGTIIFVIVQIVFYKYLASKIGRVSAADYEDAHEFEKIP